MRGRCERTAMFRLNFFIKQLLISTSATATAEHSMVVLNLSDVIVIEALSRFVH